MRQRLTGEAMPFPTAVVETLMKIQAAEWQALPT